jgi:phosphotransferase system HPr-like phosphotransfer protein
MTEAFHESIVSESEFAKLLAVRMVELCRFGHALRATPEREWVKRHYTRVVELSHEIETFLDDFGARNNKTYSYLTELIASLRGVARAAVVHGHLASRFERYKVNLDKELLAKFWREHEAAGEFFTASTTRLLAALDEELASVGVTVHARSEVDLAFPDAGPRIVLPHNIDEEDILDEEAKIAEVATRYLAASDRISEVANRPYGDLDSLRSYVLRFLDEEKARSLESQIHSIQSKYDTFVRATAIEARTPALPRLRGHASAALHLLEITTELIHFYVRHENDVRYEQAKARISNVVDKAAVLDRAVRYAFAFAHAILTAGRPFAEDVLHQFVPSQELVLDVPEGAILHARPISMIVRIVNHYGTPVEMDLEGERCDASSIMGMILAAGNHIGIGKVGFRGDERALADIRALFEAGLGEGGADTLPPRLEYLRTSAMG